jgi:hypothetical protein
MADLAGITFASFKRARSRGVVPEPDLRGTNSRAFWKESTAKAWIKERQCKQAGSTKAVLERKDSPNPRVQLPVGAQEIGVLLDVETETVRKWQRAGQLPAPRWTVSGFPAWDWGKDIRPWAITTGRLLPRAA